MPVSQADQLLAIRAKPGNNVCADCNATQPMWASINIGIFLCLNCAGDHRNLGVHITMVRSISMDTWPSAALANIENVGNFKANQYWEAKLDRYKKINPNASTSQRTQFIINKYRNKAYFGEPTGNMVAPSVKEAPRELSRAEARELRRLQREAARNGTTFVPPAPKVSQAPQVSSQQQPSISASVSLPPVSSSSTQQTSQQVDLFSGLDFGASSSTPSQPSLSSSTNPSQNSNSNSDSPLDMFSGLNLSPSTQSHNNNSTQNNNVLGLLGSSQNNTPSQGNNSTFSFMDSSNNHNKNNDSSSSTFGSFDPLASSNTNNIQVSAPASFDPLDSSNSSNSNTLTSPSASNQSNTNVWQQQGFGFANSPANVQLNQSTSPQSQGLQRPSSQANSKLMSQFSFSNSGSQQIFPASPSAISGLNGRPPSRATSQVPKQSAFDFFN